MTTYEFTLVLQEIDRVTDEAANALVEAGCDDGTFCARNGVAYVHFDREAATLESAIQSAIDQVRQAGFIVRRVESHEFTTIAQFNEQLATA
jgi:hypothetical protein